MTDQALLALWDEVLALEMPPVSTARALRLLLRRHQSVRRLSESFALGSLTDLEVERFVSRLIERFQHGHRFEHQLALGALAVVLEHRYTEFSDRFLAQLARLKLEEFRSAIEVARECLRHREVRVQKSTKSFRFAKAPETHDPRTMRYAGYASPWLDSIVANSWVRERIPDYA